MAIGRPTGTSWTPGAVIDYVGSYTDSQIAVIGNLVGATEGVDMATALQTAVNNNAVVFIPKGDWVCNSTINVPSDRLIYGLGEGSRISKTTSGSLFSVVGTDPGGHKARVFFRHLRLDGPSTQASSIAGAGIAFDYADDCAVSDCWLQGWGLTTGNDGGIAVQRSYRISVTNNLSTLNSNGICTGTPTAGQPIGAADSLFSNNITCFNWEDGLHSQQDLDCIYKGNICNDNGQVNSGSGIDLIGSVRVSIIGNICRDNGGNGIEIGGTVVDEGHVISGNICNSNTLNGISVANKTTRCTITGNQCLSNTAHGINVSSSGTTNAIQELFQVVGNICGLNTGHGINVSNTATGSVLRFCVIENNSCFSNANHGILLTGAVANNRVAGNQLLGNTSNGVRLSSQTTFIPDLNIVEGNIFSGNGTVIGQASDTNTTIRNNQGFNPQGPASITVGASPYTYTAGSTPEFIYITAGTVSLIVKSGTTLVTASPATVYLQPNESIVVTYSSVPTMVRDRK